MCNSNSLFQKGVSLALLMQLGLVFALLSPVVSIAAEPAGYVLMVRGDVFAVQSDQQLRKLKRKSPFFPGEALKTAANSKAQMRFRDGSLISMRADTEIRIDEFRYQEADKGEDRNIFTLINGGFRTITGKIGKKNPKNYQMKSSVASIGVRGTTYEVVIDNGLNVAAWQGTIVLNNQAGDITLGAEGVYNFAYVASAISNPSGRMKPPTAISNDKEIKADEMAGDGESAAEDKAAVEEQSDDGSLAQQLENSVDGETDTVAPVEKFVDSEDPVIVPKIIPDPVINPPFEPIVDPVDQRVADVTLNKIGMYQLIDFDVAGSDHHVARAGVDTNNKLHFAENGFVPDQAEFLTAAFDSVLTQGAAPELNLFTDATYGVSWGIWDGATGQAVALETDPSDVTVTTDIIQPVHWLVVDPTPDTTLAGKTGSLSYSNVIAFDGVGTGGAAINDLFMNVDVDFDTGVVLGDVHVYTAANEFWDASLSGAVSGPGIFISDVTGTYNDFTASTNAPMEGVFNSLFSGDNAEALAGMLSFEVTASPSLYVDGMFLVDSTVVNDLRLTAAESASLTHLGFAMKSNLTAGWDWVAGKASDGGVASPTIADVGYLPGDALFDTAEVVDVLREVDLAATGKLFTDSVLPVTWGVWDGATSAALYGDAFDPVNSTTLNDPFVWLTVQATTDSVLAGLNGSGKGYYRITDAGGLSYNGIYDTTTASKGVIAGGVLLDFNSAQFIGELAFDTGAALDWWKVKFGGSVVGPRLDVINVDGIYNGTSAVTGAMALAITGTSGEGLAGTFDLELAADPATYIQSAFVATLDQRLSLADGASLDRWGMALFSNIDPGAQILQGFASDGSTGSPILTEAMFESPFSFAKVIRQDSAPLSDLYVDALYPVSWGMWNAVAATPVTLQTGYQNGATVVNQDSTVMWMTATATDPLVVSSMTGGARFTQQRQSINLDLAASSNDTFVNIDFDMATFDGYTFVYTSALDTWQASFDGTVNDAFLDVVNLSVVYTPYLSAPDNNSSGVIELMFAGAAGDALVGAYEFEWDSDQTIFTQGQFILEKDLRLSSPSGALQLDKLAVSTWATNPLSVSTGGVSGSPVLVGGTGMSVNKPETWVSNTGAVLKANSVASFTVDENYQVGTVDPNFQVNWGEWNSADEFNDPTNAASFSPYSSPVYWMTVTPTPATDVFAKTGVVGYNNPIMLAGRDNAGSIISGTFSFSATIDFDSYSLSGGAIAFDAGAGTWDATFSGVLNGAGINFSAVNPRLNSVTGTGGVMSGVLTGPNADGIAGSFNFNGPSTEFAEGVFLANCLGGGAGCI